MIFEILLGLVLSALVAMFAFDKRVWQTIPTISESKASIAAAAAAAQQQQQQQQQRDPREIAGDAYVDSWQELPSKSAVIVIWAGHCSFCHMAMPKLLEAQKQVPEVSFAAITFDKVPPEHRPKGVPYIYGIDAQVQTVQFTQASRTTEAFVAFARTLQ